MSIQFGQWNTDSRIPDKKLAARLAPLIRQHGPDHFGWHETDGIHLYHATLCTTRESCAEKQPYTSASGCVFTWDGRLDNRDDLIGELGIPQDTNPTDVAIVSGAYHKWGNQAFPKLVGDWALAIWNPTERLVVLVKDFLGLRHLYYARSGSVYRWCSSLEALLVLQEESLALCEEYLAGWIGGFPAAHLTPYRNVLSVPPATFVTLRIDSLHVCRHWNFDSNRQHRYTSDQEYEEHFREMFAQSVARRLRSDTPVLAELSGGIDSSSIVCMADTLSHRSPFPRLDTVSYFDDREPNWQERQYFARVEEQRGRTGIHIDLSKASPLALGELSANFAASPADVRENHPAARIFQTHLRSGGYRVVLSGIGGDEVTGGKPTPVPELADLFAQAHLFQLLRQLFRWSLYQKKPWIALLHEVLREFLPRVFRSSRHSFPWVAPSLRQGQRTAIDGYRRRLRLFAGLPSLQENLMTLDLLKRQLASDTLPCSPPYERRFPFLDRDLLEFLFSIPREQLVRPGQRRSLLRRALRGIVPPEILDRRRKSFVARAPIVFMSEERHRISEVTTNMVANSLGLVSESAVARECRRACQGVEVPIAPLLRTLALECWLRSAKGACLPNGMPTVNLTGGALGLQEHRPGLLHEFS